MVTLVVAGLVTSSAFIFFAGQRRVYEAQSKVLNVQQNLWAAIDTLSRFVRSAGTGMVGCVADMDPTPTGATPPQTGLRVFSADAPTQVFRLAPLWIANGANGQPDTITIAFGAGTFGNFSDAALAGTVRQPTDPVTLVAGRGVVFRAGEFGLLVDTRALPAGPPVGDRGCTLFQVTGIAGDTLLRATTSPWNPPGDPPGLVPFDYTGGASATAAVRHFGRLSWIRFAVDRTGAVPRLTMARLDGLDGPTTPEVLADGIEDLQIAYACDTQPAAPGAPDGVLSEGADAASRRADEWIYNTAGDVPTATCVRPQAVRITVIARSSEPDETLANLPANAKPAAEDGVAGPRDAFRHRVLTTVVRPRNPS